MTENEIATHILDAAFQVHRELGPGLLESTYKACLFYELKEKEIKVELEKALPVVYKDVKLECGYRIDMFVENKFIVEIKPVDALNDIHMAQILTYLKLADCRLGLLINFNTKYLKDGIRRVANNL